ncbi:MAG: CesT family type III secretion system chaperone [Myxococcales bacterium]|nr:CesT family type III secretion system chaperone [Myxococcales bacterium]
MLKTEEDLERLLTKLERNFQRLENGTFLVAIGSNLAPVALRLATPVLVAQVAIGGAPTGDPAVEAALFRKLLQLNATDLLHAAYALEDGRIVLVAALELENLDSNEIEAVLADMGMAQSKHVGMLRDLIKK